MSTQSNSSFRFPALNDYAAKKTAELKFYRSDTYELPWYHLFISKFFPQIAVNWQYRTIARDFARGWTNKNNVTVEVDQKMGEGTKKATEHVTYNTGFLMNFSKKRQILLVIIENEGESKQLLWKTMSKMEIEVMQDHRFNLIQFATLVLPFMDKASAKNIANSVKDSLF